MNPRILKKLCKRAAPLVVKINHRLKSDLYVYDKDEEVNHFSNIKIDKKYLSRYWKNPEKYRYFLPLKNTLGFGGMEGYFEPEWMDNSAFSILVDQVNDHYTDWENWDRESYPECTLKINSPADVFINAEAIILNKTYKNRGFKGL